MPTVQIPLIKGLGKSKFTADYLDLLPVNILPVAKQVGEYSGYHRFYPGIDLISNVDGVSRGSDYNVAESCVYRVMGGKLYKSGSEVGEVPNSDRVSMAHSRTSQAVSTGGELYLYRYDGAVKSFSNWDEDTPDNPTYNWGSVGDVCRLRGRYVFAQEDSDTFWLSSLEDESKPDKIAPAYRAESQPDGILAIKEWHDYVVTFGSSTIEYFRLTGNANSLLQSQPSYTVRSGVVGRFAVCEYMSTFAYITSPSNGKYQIALMGQGNYQAISDRHIDKLLSNYSEGELSSVILESFQYDEHNLLIAHLPNETVVFDSSSKNWTQIKTGFQHETHRAIDYQSIGNQITVGDKLSGVYGELSDLLSSQYGDNQEIILYSLMINAPEMSIDRLSIVSNVSTSSVASNLAISVTQDGVIWGRERLVKTDKPLKWINSTILDLVGEVRGSIGFKVRVTGANPVTISGFEMDIN